MGVGIPLPTPKLSGTHGFPLPLPPFFKQSALAVGADVDGFAQAATIRKPFMPNFRRCQKVYVPINDGVFHWFLFNVNVKEGYGELHSLDFIFHSKLPRNAKPSTQFIWFLIRSGEGVPKQPNWFDYGIYVIKFMETPELIPNKSYMHDSQDVHGRLAVQLIDSAFNEARARLLAQANVIFDEHSNLPEVDKPLEVSRLLDMSSDDISLATSS
ncbi:hypothetical protein WN943_025212 [Citrus x changshan-huyou]